MFFGGFILKHNMILSASGWRKVFAASGNEQDKNKEITEESKAISIVAGAVFFEYIKELTNQENPVIAVGMDTRPTGEAMVEGILKSLVSKGAIVQYCGVTSAPEIMSFAKKLDGFIYVSASHNPIGHNGIKFGINDGGVLSAKENAKIIQKFNTILDDDIQLNEYIKKANSCSSSELKTVYQTKDSSKFNALNSYRDFAKESKLFANFLAPKLLHEIYTASHPLITAALKHSIFPAEESNSFIVSSLFRCNYIIKQKEKVDYLYF